MKGRPPPADVYMSLRLHSPFYYVLEPGTLEMERRRFDDRLRYDWGAPVIEPDPVSPGAYLCVGTRWGGDYVLFSLRLGVNGEDSLAEAMAGTGARIRAPLVCREILAAGPEIPVDHQ